MKFFKISFLMLLLGTTSLFFTACEEEAENAVDGVGDNFVRLPDAHSSPVLVGLDARPGDVTVNLAEILRDANSESALNQPMTVSLKLDDAVIQEYNAGIDTADWLEPLPASLYAADPVQVNFAAGDFSKFFKVKLDPTKLDLSKKYALGISITSADNGYKVRNGQAKALYQFIIKNKYDGKYTVDGTMVDYANAGLTGLYPLTFELITNGANQVIVSDQLLGFPGHPILSAGSTSYYGSFGLILDFDDTGKITAIKNYYGSAPDYVSGNGRSAELDPSGENRYDEATKTIKIKYWLNQPSVISPHRTLFDETWVYDSAR